jgi:putative transcriptional regulator
MVASPGLLKTPFAKAVVFILQHDKNGTFGVVLNRPADDRIRNAWRQLMGSPETSARHVVNGGPLGGPVFAIHQLQSLGQMEMPGGIFLSTDAGAFKALTSRNDAHYRIIFGIAGWQIGQLELEIQQGYWYPLQADAEQVFGDPSLMWEKLFRRYGRIAICDLLGIDRLPPDPSCN